MCAGVDVVCVGPMRGRRRLCRRRRRVRLEPRRRRSLAGRAGLRPIRPRDVDVPTCSWSAPGRPARRRRSHSPARGRDVVVVDKATFPRDKCCGDGLTTLALRQLERLGLDPATVPAGSTVDAACAALAVGARGHPAAARRHGQFAAVAPRLELDAALVELATQRRASTCATVTASTGRRQAADRRASADVDGIGTVAARYVVAADGMWSPMRKALGARPTPGYLGEWHAFRQYVGGVTGPAARPALIVWFDADLLPGYAWSFPLPDGRPTSASACCATARAGVAGHEAASWATFFEPAARRRGARPGRRARGPHTGVADPGPHRHGRRSRTGRVLFVGDAAAATDLMTGEGIGQALLTGGWRPRRSWPAG